VQLKSLLTPGELKPPPLPESDEVISRPACAETAVAKPEANTNGHSAARQLRVE
jgi:hypothetical protein